jgi:hypothetical protein
MTEDPGPGFLHFFQVVFFMRNQLNCGSGNSSGSDPRTFQIKKGVVFSKVIAEV